MRKRFFSKSSLISFSVKLTAGAVAFFFTGTSEDFSAARCDSAVYRYDHIRPGLYGLTDLEKRVGSRKSVWILFLVLGPPPASPCLDPPARER